MVETMIGMFRALVGLSSAAVLVLTPAQGFAQYRDPDEALTGAVVGGAVGGVLGGVLGGWQQRQRHHEERMERERWRQAHGDRPFPGDFAPDGPPRPRPGPDYRGPGPDGPRPFPPRERPARYGEDRYPGFGERRPGYDGPRRPEHEGRRPEWRGEPEEAFR